MQIGGLEQRFGARDQLHAVLVRQPEIGQQHVEVFLLQQLRRGLGILGQVNVVTVFQRRAQSFARRLLVIHNQQCRLHRPFMIYDLRFMISKKRHARRSKS